MVYHSCFPNFTLERFVHWFQEYQVEMEVKESIRFCGLCQQSYFNWWGGNFYEGMKDHNLIRVPAKVGARSKACTVF
jgi:hypothetical protein